MTDVDTAQKNFELFTFSPSFIELVLAFEKSGLSAETVAAVVRLLLEGGATEILGGKGELYRKFFSQVQDSQLGQIPESQFLSTRNTSPPRN